MDEDIQIVLLNYLVINIAFRPGFPSYTCHHINKVGEEKVCTSA